MKKVHEFESGLKVFDHQLLPIQRERYNKQNVHEEDEERLFIDIINGLQEGTKYVNIGTAIGYYALLAKIIRKGIEVHCFEPLPSHLISFHENIILNGFKKEDFKIHEKAISTKFGEVSFSNATYKVRF